MRDIKLIERILEEKILILDGPMGTMIQEKKLDENDFRGKKFLNSKKSLIELFDDFFVQIDRSDSFMWYVN